MTTEIELFKDRYVRMTYTFESAAEMNEWIKANVQDKRIQARLITEALNTHDLRLMWVLRLPIVTTKPINPS